MSNIPLLFKQTTAEKFNRLSRAKSAGQRVQTLAAFRPSDFQPRVGLLLGLTDPVCGLNMGETAELLAREFGLSREEQDAFALESNKRALAARERLAEEICPAFLLESKLQLAKARSNGGKAKAKGQNGEQAKAWTPTGAVAQDNGPRDNQT